MQCPVSGAKRLDLFQHIYDATTKSFMHEIKKSWLLSLVQAKLGVLYAIECVGDKVSFVCMKI